MGPDDVMDDLEMPTPPKAEVTKEALENIFKALLSNAGKEAEKTLLYQYLQTKTQWFDDPEDLATMLFFDIEKVVELYVAQKYPNAAWLTKSIYKHWEFYDSHVTRLCETREGSACCADKGRYIVKCAIKWKESGHLPVFDRENYWCPKFGTPEAWMNYVESLNHLLHGRPDKYGKALAGLFEKTVNPPPEGIE